MFLSHRLARNETLILGEGVLQLKREKTPLLPQFMSRIVDKVQPGDQIWMWRENVYKKFAHVTIYIGDEDVVHIASHKGTKFTIRRQNLFSILGNSKSFIVRLTKENQKKFRGTPQERALTCAEADITFDFTFSRDNCEAFSNYMYGVWGSNRATLQGKEVKIEDRGKARKFVDTILLRRKHI